MSRTRDEAVAAAIRRARTRNGLTQSELAEELDVSRGLIASWETARSEPSDEDFKALKRVVGRIRREYGRERDAPAAPSRRTSRADGRRARSTLEEKGPSGASEPAASVPRRTRSSSPNGAGAAANDTTPAPAGNGPLAEQELEARLWDAANSLRGPVDPSDFKAYIFPLLFFKRISDTWEWEYQRSLADFDGNDELARLLENFRFQLPDGCHWSDLVQATQLDNVGVALQEMLDHIQQANPETLTGIFGDVAWGNKERLPEPSLVGVINAFSRLKLDPETVSHDILGNAYEYLLKQFADASGKKAGEFFTPRAVVRLLTRIVDPRAGESVYDPACGSGGILVEAVNEVRESGGDVRTLRIYGQEVSLTTSAIARMNLFIHDIQDFKIVRGDTLRDPKFKSHGQLAQFDVVIANPPFSLSPWGHEGWRDDPWRRAFCGLPPASTGDFAWIQHMVTSMKPSTGRVGVVMPHGALFRGGTERDIRRCLIEQGLLDAVIGLPPKLFYSTGIEACLLVFRASRRRDPSASVMFVDGSAQFHKGKNQNALRNEHVAAIIDAYRSGVTDDGLVPCVRASRDRIAANHWDLSLSKYVSERDAVVTAPTEALVGLRQALSDLHSAEEHLTAKLKAAGYG